MGGGNRQQGYLISLFQFFQNMVVRPKRKKGTNSKNQRMTKIDR
jgi:hypothetical protein